MEGNLSVPLPYELSCNNHEGSLKEPHMNTAGSVYTFGAQEAALVNFKLKPTLCEN